MMPTNDAVKSTAKAHLKNIWLETLAVCVILGAVLLFSSCIKSFLSLAVSDIAATFFSVFYSIFIICPLIIGIIFWLWRVTVLSDSPISEIFFSFSSRFVYFRTLNFIFTVAIRLLGLVLLFMLPYALVKLVSAPNLYDFFGIQMPAWTANFLIFKNFFKLLGVSSIIFFASRYYLAPLLFVIGGDITPGEAIYMSHRIGAVSYGAFLQLFFSFAGWAFLSLLIIPALYTLPYFLMCLVVHSRYAINFYNSKQSQTGYFYTPPVQDFSEDL